MTYNSIGKLASSAGLNRRINACAAQEGAENSQMWVMNNLYKLCSAPGWAAAWESAEASATDNENPDIGMRDDVITDEMILSAVQPLVNPPPVNPT